MSESDEVIGVAAGLVGAGAEALVENADRLGLMWKFRMATVDSISPFTIIMDGDTVAQTALCMSGRPPVGTRVGVFMVPPGVNLVFWDGTVIETGGITPTFGPAVGYTEAVTFNSTFHTAPAVMTNINTGAGYSAQWHSRAFSVTTTGFTFLLFGPSTTWLGAEIQWLAVGK